MSSLKRNSDLSQSSLSNFFVKTNCRFTDEQATVSHDIRDEVFSPQLTDNELSGPGPSSQNQQISANLNDETFMQNDNDQSGSEIVINVDQNESVETVKTVPMSLDVGSYIRNVSVSDSLKVSLLTNPWKPSSGYNFP